MGEVADISTVARSLIDERADFAGTSMSPFAPAFARRPLTVMIAVPTLETGAADEDAVELARTLTSAGHRAVVVSRGGRLEGDLAACGGQLVRLDVASINPVVIARNAFVLARLIRRRHCGVVHALARAPGWSGYAAARMTGVAFLTTWYGGFRDQNLFKHAYNGVMARGEQVIAMSDQIADIIAERHRVAADRIIVIPSHIDITRFDPARIAAERVDAARAAWGVGPGTRVIMVVGRILRRKGHHVIVRAARRLKDMGLRDVALALRFKGAVDLSETHLDARFADAAAIVQFETAGLLLGGLAHFAGLKPIGGPRRAAALAERYKTALMGDDIAGKVELARAVENLFRQYRRQVSDRQARLHLSVLARDAAALAEELPDALELFGLGAPRAQKGVVLR